MPPLISRGSQWALSYPIGYFLFSLRRWRLLEEEGSRAEGGNDATDLSVASGVEELVAAVALETQLVPVLPQR